MTITDPTSTPFHAEADLITVLQQRVHGQVIVPGDPRYAEARLAWNRSVDQSPVLIVIASRAEDVAEAVRFARAQGLGIAAQSTGHGITLPADGALLILTSHLKDLIIDPAGQTAWVSAGLKWGEVLAETQQYGLTPLLGSSPTVGVVGYTLGGGLGWLGRKHGLATDSVLTFELVSATGEILRASAEENPELFWGLRGGGGSFGIITGMQIRLYPVDMIYGGNLMYPIEDAREVMQRYREWIRTAPDALTTSVVLMNFPPIPQLPEILRGKSYVMVRGCYAGPIEEGEAHLRYWRDWKAPVIDDFKAMPFREVAKISSDPVNPGPSHGSGAWMRALTDEAIDTLIRYHRPAGGPPALTVIEVRHAGGAISRVPPESAAFSHRDSQLVLFCVGMTPTPQAFTALRSLTDHMKEELAPALTGVYMNFVHGHEARERTRQGFSPEAYQRLQALKARMDPENIFRYSYDMTGEK